MIIRSIVISGALILVALFAHNSLAVDYFPSEAGPSFVYYGGVEVVINDGLGSDFARIRCPDCRISSSQGFRIDSDGDVLQTSVGSFFSDGSWLYQRRFEPPLLYLDLPLEPAKSWVSTAEVWGLDGEYEGLVDLFMYARREKNVDVPAGNFDVFEVEMYYRYRDLPAASMQRTLWMQKQLGPINENNVLMSWTGVVSNSSVSWGSIKAIYR